MGIVMLSPNQFGGSQGMSMKPSARIGGAAMVRKPSFPNANLKPMKQPALIGKPLKSPFQK